MIQPVRIDTRMIGPGHPCFIIAEAGVNHNGEVRLAKRLIEEAKAAGADAIKFQTFSTGSVIVKDAPKAKYQLQTTDHSESQFEMLERLRLTHEEFAALKAHADQVGVTFFSSPSDSADIDFLIRIGVAVLKIASMDLVNYPHLDHAGRQGLPVILSTGMATLGEVENGLKALRQAGCEQVIILHCVTDYPVRDDQANLRVMDTLGQAFQVPVGFSDHTTGTVVPIAAVARGACVIEKHFTFDRQLPGPDHAASLDPAMFKAMVNDIRTVERALGSPVKLPLPVELENRKTMRRSLVASVDLLPGAVLRHEHFALKRPGGGLGAEFIDLLIGQKLKINLSENAKFKLSDIDWSDRENK